MGCPSDTIFINEVHYQNRGPDLSEFVEVAYITGYPLTGHRLLFYDGGTGRVYKTTNLSTDLAASNDDVSIGFTFAAYSVYSFSNQVRDGPDGIALVDGNDAVLDFIAYGRTFTASNGPAEGLTPLLMGVVEAANGGPQNSLQLGGVGSQASHFTWQGSQLASPASVNTGQTIVCGGAARSAADPVLVTPQRIINKAVEQVKVTDLINLETNN